PYTDNNDYFYRVVIAKLVFVLLFEHVVFMVSAFIAFLIPDVPTSIKNQILRERHLTKETLFAKLDADKTPATSPIKVLEDVEKADSSET
ncbi:anoctamin, partial [Salmonella sp. s51228]|uniref:anoctamin n=1 Tax=Salmonella sp. s51228 TaxID=3159652 RepID=UPI0039817B1F